MTKKIEQLPFVRCQFVMSENIPLPSGAQADYTVFPERYYTIDFRLQVHLIEHKRPAKFIGLLHELFTIDEMLTNDNETLRMYGQGYLEGLYNVSDSKCDS